MKFNIVIGNPPYTQGNGKTKLFDKFTYISNELLSETGILSFVIPKAWYCSCHPTNVKYRRFLQANNLKSLRELPDDIFNATVKTTYFILDKQYDNSAGVSFTNNVDETFTLPNTGFIFNSKNLRSIVAKVGPKPNQYSFKSLYKKVQTVEEETTIVGVSNADGITLTQSNLISPNNDTYRLTTGYMRNSYYHIDSIHIAEPGINIKSGYVQRVCKSKEEAENIHSVLQSKLAKYIFSNTRTSRTLDSSQLNYIPFLNDKMYTDEDLYKLYNLTEEEIVK